MGTCKLLLAWRNKTILVHLLDQWRTLRVAQIAPVIDASNQSLKTALVDARFSSGEWIDNFFPERGMFSSLQEASRWKGWRSGLTHMVVALGDQPHIKISTLRLLLETAHQNPSCICQPVLNQRGCHPIILPADQFLALAKSDAPDLRAFICRHENLRLRVAVNDPGVIGDLDTPADYALWNP
jgi:CTP:molybdopterin cytidylyltransferase MocA